MDRMWPGLEHFMCYLTPTYARPPHHLRTYSLLHLVKSSHDSSIIQPLLALHKLIFANLGQDFPPKKPVHHSANQNNDPNDRIQPIWQTRISLTIRRVQERRHDEEQLAGKEETRDRPPYLERSRRLRELPAEDEQPDDDQRREHARGITLDVNDEVERVAKRNSHNDDETRDEMQQQTRARRTSRPGPGPKASKGDHAFLSELLVDSRLSESDGQDVAQGRQRDEDGQDAPGRVAEDFADEVRRHRHARSRDLFWCGGGEVGDVGQEVEDAAYAEAEGSGDLQCADRALYFVENLDLVSLGYGNDRAT